jgi:polyisoprenyl-teichoic acid--peptidoglycan teichoic acid transferase
MTHGSRGRVVAGFLSMLVPGAGQLYVGARRRGLVLLAISAALAVGLLALLVARPLGSAASLVGRPLLAAVLLGNVALLTFRLFAIVDAWNWGRGAASGLAVLALGAFAALAAAPHVAAGYVAVRGYGVLESVFADEEPRDVLRSDGLFLAPTPQVTVTAPRSAPPRRPARRVTPALPPIEPLEASRRVLVGEAQSFEHPWVTLLLLGSDAGPGQWGTRTDTMIVVALQRGTGRAAAFGVPRNLVEVPLVGAAGAPPRFRQPLNALYAFARSRPELFPGGPDPGATALKQALSRLLGIRIDYYALVDLDGFADIVDALGGVRIHVKERLVDEVTRPAWGETKPRIDVYPGRTYHFYGRTALAYVRSRKASNDYTRMARQRCFLSAFAQQLDVVRILQRFRSLAGTVEDSVRTDVPLARAPDLIQLAGAIDPRQTHTATFGVEYIARRRASDRYPVPNVARIRATVRDVILLQSREGRELTPASEAC